MKKASAIPRWRPSFQGLQLVLVLLVARKRLGLLKRLLAGEHIRPRPPTGHVIPVEISRWPSVRKADFKTAALRNAFVRDDVDAIGHASLKRGRANRQWPSVIGSSGPARSDLPAVGSSAGPHGWPARPLLSRAPSVKSIRLSLFEAPTAPWCA